MSIDKEDLGKLVNDKLKSDLAIQCLEEDGFFAQKFLNDGYRNHYFCRVIEQTDPQACCKYAMNFLFYVMTVRL